MASFSLDGLAGWTADGKNWFGCYTWDPVNNILYASAMANPAFQLECGHHARP